MSRTEDGYVAAPSRTLQMLETAVSPLEAMGFVALQPILRLAGRGDNHPVLILPGFGAGDSSTVPLRWMIRGQGYWVHAWRLGRNIGPTRRAVHGMRQRIEELFTENDQKVTLIGQSLGGIYARYLAREQPEMVRQVITLGSPYRMMEGDRSSAERFWRQVEHLHDGGMRMRDVAEQDKPALTVPATSIYTRTDGVAPWQTCIDVEGELAENIEVYGTHIGMGVNPAVVLAILDRLSQQPGEWRPFDPPTMVRTWYPRQASWRDRQRGARGTDVAATAKAAS